MQQILCQLKKVQQVKVVVAELHQIQMNQMKMKMNHLHLAELNQLEYHLHLVLVFLEHLAELKKLDQIQFHHLDVVVVGELHQIQMV